MTRAAIERELNEKFPGQLKERDLKVFTDGLETIQRIIAERPYLKTSVDFESIRKTLYEDYRLWLSGKKECIVNNKIMKASRFVLTLGTIYGTLPMIIDELSTGIVRPEFRFSKSKGKFLSKDQFLKLAGKCERSIREKIESGDIPNDLIERGRKRGTGWEIKSISRDALEKLKK